MSWITAVRRVVNEAVDTGLSYLPPDTVAHLERASTELLLAARAVIDEQIRWNSRHVERAAAIREARRARAEAPSPDLATEGASRPD
ncbi:MAG TPA: hypothetical protein VIM86_04960 [Thermodesulfobacteriota bacterium]